MGIESEEASGREEGRADEEELPLQIPKSFRSREEEPRLDSSKEWKELVSHIPAKSDHLLQDETEEEGKELPLPPARHLRSPQLRQTRKTDSRHQDSSSHLYSVFQSPSLISSNLESAYASHEEADWDRE